MPAGWNTGLLIIADVLLFLILLLGAGILR
jgi:hypothetical protein